MKAPGMLLLAVGLALAALPAGAQEEGRTSFRLLSDQENADFIWRDEAGVRNPELVVPANGEITVTIVKGPDPEGLPHNIQVGTGAVSGDVLDEGDEQTYTFTAPASGTVEYVCTYHPVTMKGTVRVAGSPAEGGGNGTPGLPLVGLVLALAGAALLVRRR